MKNKHFPLILYAQADQQTRQIYDEIMAMFETDFVFNYFKALANDFNLLKGTWEKVKATFFGSSLSIEVKEEIIYRISKRQQCSYCSYVHAKAIEELKQQINALKGCEQSSLLSDNEEAAVELVTEAVLSNPVDAESVCDRLIALGFTPAQIPELLSMAELTVMFNTHSRLFGIQIDEELL